MVTQSKQSTVSEFENFLSFPENQQGLFELIDGEIVEKVTTQEHGIIALRIGSKLIIFVEQNGLGWVAVEARHRMPDDPHNSLLPDVAYTSNTEPVKKGAVLQMPDLAVEIKSPDDTYIGMRRKAEYYIANGSRLVWLVYPEKRLVEVYQPDVDVQILDIDDTLEGGKVLPGFSLAVSEIFPK